MNKEFIWTDELVHEYVSQVITGTIGFSNSPMDKFKASHTEVKRDWVIVDWDNSNVTIDSLHRGTYGGLSPDGMIGRGYKIKSVKRLSDGVVFSVGDEVRDKIVDGSKKIINFTIDMSEMLVGFMGHGRNIKEISKLPERTKLFTTEDGVDVFNEEMEIFYTKNFRIIKRKAKNAVGLNNKRFYLEKNAEDHILMNKPTLSVNNIFDLEELPPSETIVLEKSKIIELAKSKL